jgi:hypothetical protein
MREKPLVYRRAEVMAELLLQELSPMFVARNVDIDVAGIDFVVGFKNSKGGINVVAVEVKGTDKPVRERFVVGERTYRILSKSNIPALLLVVDVKTNRYYYNSDFSQPGTKVQVLFLSVPVCELDDQARMRLVEQLSA